MRRDEANEQRYYKQRTDFPIPSFFKSCKTNLERIAYIIKYAEGILTTDALHEKIRERQMEISEAELADTIESLLRKCVIETCGEGRGLGYRYITDLVERFGTTRSMVDTSKQTASKPVQKTITPITSEGDGKVSGSSFADLPGLLAAKESKDKERKSEPAIAPITQTNQGADMSTGARFKSPISDDELLKFISDRRPSTKEVQMFLNVSSPTASKRMESLRAAGKVERTTALSPWKLRIQPEPTATPPPEEQFAPEPGTPAARVLSLDSAAEGQTDQSMLFNYSTNPDGSLNVTGLQYHHKVRFTPQEIIMMYNILTASPLEKAKLLEAQRLAIIQPSEPTEEVASA